MTKRYAILHKKLQELENELNSLLRLPPDSQLPEQDIEQRLDFLNTLFSAEANSSPQSQHHLQHIAKRIALLETAFQERKECKTTPLEHAQIDAVSDCSCTESCLNDEEEDVVVDSEKLGTEMKKERVRVRGATDLAMAMAVGFVFGTGFMSFILRHCLFQCSYYASATMSYVPT